MTYLPHLLGRMVHQPLLCEPEYVEVVLSVLSDRFNIEAPMSAEATQPYVRPARSGYFDKASGIVVVPIVGALVHRSEGINPPSGMTGYTALQNTLAGFAGDPNVRGVLLDMDTPGGEVAGLTELAEYIKAIDAEKPVWAIANGLASSAGYWIASSASRVIAAPNSRVGSIGVITAHVDRSKEMEKRGQRVTLIHAGKHKAEGNPYEPLPDDVRARVQASVDSTYADFVSVVARNRGIDESKVRDTEAGVFDPEAAVAAGLVDGIGTLGETLNAFRNHLNQRSRFTGFSSERTTMTDRLIYSEADRAAALAEGASKASADFDSRLKAAVAEAKAEGARETATALAAMLPDDKRVAAFSASMAEGMSIGGATKIAAMVEAPAAKVSVTDKSATAKDVDRIMAAVAPNVSVDASNPSEADPKAARLAEIKANMSAARGRRL